MQALRLGGNYVGPGWCGGKRVSEESCDFSVPPTGCVDRCAQGHDQCCGHSSDISGCDRAMISCMQSCPPSGTEFGMLLKVTLLPELCCGSPCPSTALNQAQYHPSATNAGSRGLVREAGGSYSDASSFVCSGGQIGPGHPAYGKQAPRPSCHFGEPRCTAKGHYSSCEWCTSWQCPPSPPPQCPPNAPHLCSEVKGCLPRPCSEYIFQSGRAIPRGCPAGTVECTSGTNGLPKCARDAEGCAYYTQEHRRDTPPSATLEASAGQLLPIIAAFIAFALSGLISTRSGKTEDTETPKTGGCAVGSRGIEASALQQRDGRRRKSPAPRRRRMAS